MRPEPGAHDRRFGRRGLGRMRFSDRDFATQQRTVLEHADRSATRTAFGAAPLGRCGLTPRESEVAMWLSRGKTNREIARIVSSSARTVEKHVERVLAKLGVENRTAAAVMVAEASWTRGSFPGD
jgi:DNA-binding NarL/FixJ family response regulator